MQRGEVIKVDLPAPKGRPGHEQIGPRPAVVVQVEDEGPNLSTVVVVPFTKNKAATRFAGSVQVKPSSGNGLTMVSVALVHQIRAVDKRRCVSVIGQLDDADLEAIDTGIRSVLGL